MMKNALTIHIDSFSKFITKLPIKIIGVTLLCFQIGVYAKEAPLNSSRLKTQVYVMGMIHGEHLKSTLWGIPQVKTAIEAIDPDVICIEMPPNRWHSVIEEWQKSQTFSDSRIKVFPEYTQAILPLSQTMDFAIEPCAGWSEKMAKERRERIKLFSTSPETAEAYKNYQAEELKVKAYLDSHPIVEDDPKVIHSKAYDERTQMELAPYDKYLNDFIGAGGWTHINQAHYQLIEQVLKKHAGKKILITFGAGHKYWILHQLAKRQDVEINPIPL